MNSLKFVDEEIKRYKAVVRITSGNKKSYYKKVVNQLQQIKTELEIMELIENGWSSMEQTLSGEKIIKFQKLNLDDWLKVWKTLEEIALKKALEVGNNHEETR